MTDPNLYAPIAMIIPDDHPIFNTSGFEDLSSPCLLTVLDYGTGEMYAVRHNPDTGRLERVEDEQR